MLNRKCKASQTHIHIDIGWQQYQMQDGWYGLPRFGCSLANI